ncbi:hypothetical protein IT403_02285 [Candidatus Nomurabacteria bacterium]|nr:hypothetical protein [Candidatus Nomurabacteria bacterium]
MNVTILISIRPYILIYVLCLIAVSGVIAMCYKVYIHVPQKKDRAFYKDWVEQNGGLHDVFKKYHNYLPKEFFEILDNLDDCTLALNFIDRKRYILYKRILIRYILQVQKARNMSSEKKISLLCALYSREYGQTTFFTNNVSRTLLKKILNMIFQSQYSDSILNTVVAQVKEGTPLRKILEKKLEEKKKPLQ